MKRGTKSHTSWHPARLGTQRLRFSALNNRDGQITSFYGMGGPTYAAFAFVTGEMEDRRHNGNHYGEFEKESQTE